MIVRPADYEKDAAAILSGAKDFISRMDFTDGLPKDDAGLADALTNLIGLPGFELTVAEYREKIVGGIGVLYAPFAWNRAVLSASELFWWTARDAPTTTALRLIRFVHAQAKDKGVGIMEFVSLTSSPEGVSKVYRRMGFRDVQTSWAGVP